MLHLARAIIGVLADVLKLGTLFLRSSSAIRAENLVLRRQLARYLERGIKPRRVDHVTRVSLAVFSRLFDWRDVVVAVQPSTMIRWHRLGWRIFWWWKCKAGRRPIPPELRKLIRRMAAKNPIWGEERIASESLVKFGIQASPRTVGKYMPTRAPGPPRGDRRWSTFLNNHAKAILACYFFIAVTATFRILYVFVVIEHGTRRLAHVNVTSNPSADWTLQQSQRVGTRRPGSTAGIGSGPEVRISTSIGGGGARAREIDLGRLAPRILARGRARECITVCQRNYLKNGER